MFKTSIAKETWRKKYQYNNETPLETQIRIAKALASVEKEPEKWEELFLKTLVRFDNLENPIGLKCTPGGRITANIGTDFKGASLLNCFSGGTKYITIEGLKSFKDTVGTRQKILAENGIWEEAEVKKFGKQPLNKIIFKPCVVETSYRDEKSNKIVPKNTPGAIKKTTYRILGKVKKQEEIFATYNHRWPLVDGNYTERIQIGDVIKSNFVNDKHLDIVLYNKGFVHGLVFGDGSKGYETVNGEVSFQIRLCGNKIKHLSLFEHYTYPPSCNGEPVCIVKSQINLKQLPQNKNSSYIKGFIEGWIAADGSVLSKDSYQLSSKNLEALQWVEENCFYAQLTSFTLTKDKNLISNLKPNNETPLYRINFTKTKKIAWKVVDIIGGVDYADVFCLEVPLSHMFTLANGIYTSNCYINGPVKNATITYERKVPNSDITIPVVYKSPDTGDNMTNIVLTLLEQALTLGSEGGWGINMSFIRPRGSLVKTIGVEHPGVIKFMEIFDKMADVIVAGNNDGYTAPLKNYMTEQQLKDLQNLWKVSKKKMSRKGAMMCVLDINHPDIEEFILAKQQGKQLTKFNLSVLMTDEFLKAVEENDFFELKFDGKVYKKIKARQLYDLVMSSTYNRNEPGVLFYDNMQKNNPISYLGSTNSTNPCGEISGCPETTTTCLLGSLNLTQYVLPDRTFDWNQYEEDIKIFAHMLDNVIDLQNKDLPAYLWSIKNVRQYGMGLTGFGSMLYMMGIPYNSPQAIEMAEDLNKAKLNLCLQASALLAKEKGCAPMFDKEKYFKTNYWTKFLKGKLTEETIELVKTNGLRNLKHTTNPPSGNTSVICDNVSNGLEPVFMHNYERTIICNWPEGLTMNNVKSILKEIKVADVTCWRGDYNGVTYYYEPHNRGLCTVEIIYDYGYKWVWERYVSDLKENKGKYVTTNDLKVEDHLAIQVAFQSYIDQSVSKTCNLSKSYSFSDFKELYLSAWKNGLIGFTTYRDGTMESVLSKIEEKKVTSESHIIKKTVKLPEKFINGPTHVIKREHMKFYLHFSYLDEDKTMHYPIALWIQTNHQFPGEAVYVNRALRSLSDLLKNYEINESYITKLTDKYKNDLPSSKIAKLVSMCLRHNLPIPSIIGALENLEGDNISSLLTAVRKFLSMHIEDGTKAVGKKCDCGSTNIVYESGCSKCLDCGSSNCG